MIYKEIFSARGGGGRYNSTEQSDKNLEAAKILEAERRQAFTELVKAVLNKLVIDPATGLPSVHVILSDPDQSHSFRVTLILEMIDAQPPRFTFTGTQDIPTSDVGQPLSMLNDTLECETEVTIRLKNVPGKVCHVPVIFWNAFHMFRMNQSEFAREKIEIEIMQAVMTAISQPIKLTAAGAAIE